MKKKPKETPPKEKPMNEALLAVKIASAMIGQMEHNKFKPELAYAAFGNAFSRMHLSLGKTKEEWLEVTRLMADHF